MARNRETVLAATLAVLGAAGGLAFGGYSKDGCKDDGLGICKAPKICKLDDQAGKCEERVINHQITGELICACIVKSRYNQGISISSTEWLAEAPIVIPPPGADTTMTFHLDPAHPVTQLQVDLGVGFGAGTLFAVPLSGTVTVVATRHVAPDEAHLFDLHVVDSLLVADSLNIPGFGPTGINSAVYTNVSGYFDMNTREVGLIGDGVLTNSLVINGQTTIPFRTHFTGYLDVATGQLGVVSVGINTTALAPPVPATTTWGLAGATLLLSGMAGVVLARRRVRVPG
ncbi:MAG TPA: hypothetical protein PKK06_12890 [Phycisphaerae bacterium]|nr:hypothetical protein [Phycisphaerae bacterium]HNU44376.1 hypothetical protein [Phycisphaerae bacterium]